MNDSRAAARRPLDLSDLADKLLAGMPDALVVADAGNVIRHWNAGATRLFGYCETEAVGSSLDIIIPQQLRARHLAGFEKTMATGETKYAAGELLAVPAIRRDGRRISVQFSITPLSAPDGSLAGIAAVMRDVTADFERRKQLEAEVARLRSRAGAGEPSGSP